MVMVGSGGMGGNPYMSNLFSQLGFETDQLFNQVANMKPFMLSELSAAFTKGLGGGVNGGGGIAPAAPGGPLAPLAAGAGDIHSLFVKLAFIAVLKTAIEKAAQAPNFNAETAINDLWVHLDSVKRMDAGANGVTVESKRLEGLMQKQKQMFGLMSRIMDGLK